MQRVIVIGVIELSGIDYDLLGGDARRIGNKTSVADIVVAFVGGVCIYNRLSR